jgi:hypothetical protein
MSAYYSIYTVLAVGNTQVFSSVNFIIGWSLSYGCVHMNIHEYFTVSQQCISHELLLLSKTICTRVFFVYFLAFKLLQYDKLGFQACVYFGNNFARIIL